MLAARHDDGDDCLVGFYGISTIVGYLIPNFVHAYILNIYDLIITSLMCLYSFLQIVKWFQFYSRLIICLHRVNWLQVLLFNTNYSIQYYSFVCIHLNGSKYCSVSVTVQLNNHLFTHS